MVKVGLIGAGFMGAMHAQCHSLLPGVKLTGIADIRKEKAAELAGKFNSAALENAEELLRNPEVDAIDICLPTFMHADWTVKALQAGKHVICEKPIALNVADADRMVETAEKSGRIFMVAQVIRFWPEYMRLKEICSRGELGKMLSLSLTRLSPTPTWSWDGWLLDSPRGGGALIDLHIHDTDYLLHLLGKPLSVYSAGRNIKGAYWHIHSCFKYPGCTVTAEGGWDYADSFPFRMAFTANFEKGAVEYSSIGAKPFGIFQTGSAEYQQPAPEEKQADGGGNISSLGGYYNEIKYFIECVAKGRKPAMVTPADARDSLTLVLKEGQSAEKDKEIAL